MCATLCVCLHVSWYSHVCLAHVLAGVCLCIFIYTYIYIYMVHIVQFMLHMCCVCTLQHVFICVRVCLHAAESVLRRP